MFASNLLAPWDAWTAALAAPLHRHLAWRLPIVLTGLVLASGRRTATSWWRAAQPTTGLRSYYYLLDVLGRKADAIARVLLRLVASVVPDQATPLFALDDSPTKRSGPKVQGAGVHHNPTPGKAGSKFLDGHSWVTLNRVVRHPLWGTLGLPLLARLYVRKVDVAKLPGKAKVAFCTKLQLAAEMLNVLAADLDAPRTHPWVVVDGGYSKRQFLKPVIKAGFVVVARLRSDAALNDLPPVLPPGAKKGPGRPPVYG